MSNLSYTYTKTREQLNLAVTRNSKVIWSATYPSYTENAVDGELVEDPTIVEMGAMSNLDDVDGLKKYLTNQGVVNDSDVLLKK